MSRAFTGSQEARGQGDAIHRIVPQLAARKFPRGDARADVPIRGAVYEIDEAPFTAIGFPARGVRPAARGGRQHSANEQAAREKIAAERQDAARLDGVRRQCLQRPVADPRPRLHLGDDEPRGDERIRDVRGQIHLQAIQPQERSGNPANQEMEAVDRRQPMKTPSPTAAASRNAPGRSVRKPWKMWRSVRARGASDRIVERAGSSVVIMRSP
jgi:hypothetical protein